MANSVNYIPRSDDRFNAWAVNLLRYIDFHSANWDTPAVAFTEVQAMLDPWKAALANADNPETRTKATVKVKNELRKAFEAEIRRVVKAYITYNPAVTDADRDNMALPVHKTTHTPAPAPTTVPEFRVDTSIIRRLTVHFQAAGSKIKAKPAGVHGAEIRWAIIDAPAAGVETPKLGVSTLVNSSFDTNSPLTLEFDEPERGKSVYLCLRWENTRGEKGPWSDIMMAIVP
ncbi:MAG: hypothetical protein LBN37_03900 [Bacteroidales bacterium]|jgi:hypothetical protein|nr:hypothetical protein [Bacteroidales bacterium]